MEDLLIANFAIKKAPSARTAGMNVDPTVKMSMPSSPA